MEACRSRGHVYFNRAIVGHEGECGSRGRVQVMGGHM